MNTNEGSPTEESTRFVSAKHEKRLREFGLSPRRHYRLPQEKPFTRDQRSTTTILFGNLTPKHEALIKSVFDGAGYCFQNLPNPDHSAFLIGKEFCSNGLCNPNYYTAGALIQYLEQLEEEGLSRNEIQDRFIYFTLTDCGPCRFGLYESEYRQALSNAGFPGFRVITFRNTTFFSEGTSQPGLQFNADIGMGALNSLILGDLLYEIPYRIRPYEVESGATDQALNDCTRMISDFLRDRDHFEILESSPRWLAEIVSRRDKLTRTLNNLGKYVRHFYGRDFREVLDACAKRIDQVDLDLTRAKPIVKVTGEFYSHLSESHANYNIFRFLEREGAQVEVDTITGHLLYWLYRTKLCQLRRRGLQPEIQVDRFRGTRGHLAHLWFSFGKPMFLEFLIKVYRRQYRRIASHLGNIAHGQIHPRQLARVAEEFFDPLTRGGEGFLEVGKSIYYSSNHLCHLVLSIKPFG